MLCAKLPDPYIKDNKSDANIFFSAFAVKNTKNTAHMVILTKNGIKFSVTNQGAAAFEKEAVRISEKYPNKFTFHLLEKSDICDAYTV